MTPTTPGLQLDPDARAGGSRVHIDLGGEPRDVATRRLVAPGATVVGEERVPRSAVPTRSGARVVRGVGRHP